MSKPKQKGKPQFDPNQSIDESIITGLIKGTDPESLPFLEWSDQDVNSEKWSDDQGHPKDKLLAAGPQQKVLFEDAQEVRLPPSVWAEEWKRASELYQGKSKQKQRERRKQINFQEISEQLLRVYFVERATFAVCVPQTTYPDLIAHNKHLLHSEFYRSFISAMEILMYIGSTKPFADEYGSPVFNAQVERNWKPWHHIYSNCKITKGQQEHTPLYNPSGKYIVRLFWMGTWRKIYVDDLIPLDRNENILLPVLDVPKPVEIPQKVLEKITQPKGGKKEEKGKGKDKEEKISSKEKKDKSSDKSSKSKKGAEKQKWTIELWPMILCKALFKIASLSWNANEELHHFDIVQCLTGWTPQKSLVKGIPQEEIWDILLAYAQRFQWEETNTKKSGKSKDSKSSKDSGGGRGADKGGKKGKKGKSGGNDELIGLELQPEVDHYVVACCNNFENPFQADDNPHGNSNHQKIDSHHNILISQVRTLPLEKPPPRPELEFWKTWRYEKWATEQGIIPIDIKKVNIKSLKIVSTYKRFLKKEHSKDSIRFEMADTNSDKKSEKSAKINKSTSKKGKGGVKLEPDPSFWLDFDRLKPHVGALVVYFRPKNFKTKTQISDIQFSTKNADFDYVVYPYEIKEFRNEPLYIFTDSIDHKLLVINLCQTGNIKMLGAIETHSLYKTASLDSCQSDEDICMKIIKAKTMEPRQSWRTVSEITFKSLKFDQQHNIPVNFLLTEYNWYTNVYGKNVGSLRTMGSSTFVLDLKPGRQCFKLWITSHTSYVLQIFADTPVTVGKLEEFLNQCKQESQALTNLCYEISTCFGKLVNSFGMPEYSMGLRNFYNSYKPTQNLSKMELGILHNAMLEELFRMAQENSSAVRVENCLRLLFMQLRTFNYINPYTEEPHLLSELYLKDAHVDYLKIMEKAAVKLQAFFKGVYIRSLMKKTSTTHKQHMAFFETLKIIYKEVFSSEKRLNSCLPFIRKVFEREEMKAIREKFDIYQDMKNVLCTIKFGSQQQTTENSYVCLCRYDFFVNSVQPIPIKINMFTSLKYYYVRVFNKDTNQEMQRLTNNVVVNDYHTNVKGYTVLCYAYAEEPERCIWKLFFITQKMSRDNLLIIPEQTITNRLLQNNYMPNCDNIICKYTVKVATDTLLTAHLTTSFDGVKLKLRILNANGGIVKEAQGKGKTLIPMASLDAPVRILKISSNANILSSKSNQSLQATSREQLVKKGVQELKSISEKNLRKSIQAQSSFLGSKSKLVQFSPRSMNQEPSNHSPSKDSRRRSQRSSVTFLPIVTSFEEFNEYTIVATVEFDSWPLTSEEWKTVEKLRRSNYVCLTNEGVPAIPSSFQRLMGIHSTNNNKLSQPYFVLDMAYNSGDGIQFIEDRRKEDHRRNTKIKWYEDNEERFTRAKELRDIYLEEHLTEQEESTDLVEKTSIKKEMEKEKRSNNPEDFALKKIEMPDFSQFLLKPLEEVDEEKCVIKRSTLFQFEPNVLDRALRENRESIKKRAGREVVFEKDEITDEDLETEIVAGDISTEIQDTEDLYHQGVDEFLYQSGQNSVDQTIIKTIKNIVNLNDLNNFMNGPTPDITPDITPCSTMDDLFRNQSVNFVNHQVEDTQFLAGWFADLREDSGKIMEESRNLLKQYVEKLESAGKGKKKDQIKGKKDKKVKK